MKKPNFFILGAPMCGSKSLADQLAEHPQIFMTSPREPHYFNQDMGNRQVQRRSEYLQLFAAASDGHLAVGEASSWYLYSQTAVPAIEQAVPDARYIVLLRSPVEMLRLMYMYNRLRGYEDAETLEKAWLLQDRRRRGLDMPRGCPEREFLQYRAVCALGRQLQLLYERVDSERILPIVLDDLLTNPHEELRRVFCFLELDGREFFAAENARRESRVQRQLMLGERAARLLHLRYASTHMHAAAARNDMARGPAAVPQRIWIELDQETRRLQHLLQRSLRTWLSSAQRNPPQHDGNTPYHRKEEAWPRVAMGR